MHAHALLNLLNELGKRDKMRGLPSILSLFRNRVNLCLFFFLFSEGYIILPVNCTAYSGLGTNAQNIIYNG